MVMTDNNLPAGFSKPLGDAALEAAVLDVLTTSSYRTCRHTLAFLDELADFVGTSYAIGTASRVDAMRIALAAFDVRSGTEVITVSYGPATACAAALQLGAVPRLIDIDEHTATMSTARLCEAINGRTAAIVAVHLNGRPADMDAIMDVANEFGIPVIEDASEALGAQYRGIRVGSIGDLAVIGLDLAAHLHATGEGAAVTTDSGELAERLAVLAGQTMLTRANNDTGWHTHLDEMQAAMLRVHLDRLDETNDDGYLRVDRLLPRLRQTDGVIFRSADVADSYSVYGSLLLRCQSVRGLEQIASIPGLVQAPARSAVHLSPEYADRVVTGDLPNTRLWLESALLI